MSCLIDRSRVEIKLADYGVAPSTALEDVSLLPQVQEYRRLTGSRMVPVDGADIIRRIPKADYHVSRKVDGEFTVLVYRDDQCVSLNPGGTVRVGLPWQDEAAQLLSDAGIQSAMVAGELYAENKERRPRGHDVTALARQPQSADELSRLRFAVFDLLSIDGASIEQPFAETWAQIETLFGKGERIHPVECKLAESSSDVENLFAQWVEQQGAEGLVVRSDTAGLFKVKPRHNLDAVVIGFSESAEDRQGLLHDLLLAVTRHDGTLHVLTKVGGGFSEDERREMLSDLKDMVVESEYAEVNSDHVAYKMVRPEWVVEISCLDLIAETTRGGPVNRMVLSYGESGYETVRRFPLAAVISPQFVRRREDKSAQRGEAPIEQVSQRVEVPMIDRNVRQMSLPKSELLRRDIYTKQSRGKTMVRKFVTWKTNKENESYNYPAYVLHYTDFSPNRKEPLSRDICVSSSLKQIDQLCDEMIAENIKKGWELHSRMTTETPAQEKVVSESAAGAKKTGKKKRAKKATKK